MNLLTRITQAQDALQAAVYGLLSRRLETKTPIYDYVPDNTEWPYITFGRIDTKPDGAKDIDISVCTMDFNIFSNYKGRAEINRIASVLSVNKSNYNRIESF